MKFRTVARTSAIPNNRLVYRADEFSFDTEPPPVAGFTSILVNDLNLEVDDAGRVISVWGVCPHMQWERASLSPPVADVGEAFVISEEPLKRGVSTRMNPRNPPLADPTSGWIRIKSENVPDLATEILPGVILETSRGGDFCSIWLRPEYFPKM